MSTFKFIGIDTEDFPKDILYGFLTGLGFILLPFILPGISVAISQSILEEQIVRVILAPVIEEFAFRSVLLSYFMNLFADRLKMGSFGAVAAIPLQAGIFAIYHVAAYGVGATAAYVGAFVFAIAAGILTLRTRNILASTLAHLIINGYLLLFGAGGLVVVG